ncbi:hypothetical protein [Streptomyces coffeae]|uniref:Glycosyl transferase family 3 domain-containing protein n=1 Tax=Streptomyces coffeae TaxID=621382 RepID=A0ABS1NGP3_9ACTN|nr:hypothetical protein [Streptomyces coffeae]MBL1099258.1 hypothetical protein [Streptomyces coffeae]
MNELLPALIARDRPVPVHVWAEFWERLRTGDGPPGEALATLTAMSTLLPDAETLDAFLTSLDQRRDTGPRGAGPLPAIWPGTVNVVGTGGGPPTVNLSTAAALLAATLGVRIVKTGSRGYTGRTGSVDVLERLGIPLAASYAQCEDGLDRHGIAFAGGFVYPPELTTLARRILPYGLKHIGRVVNILGPLLARVPVAAQLTGVSDSHVHTVLTGLAARRVRPGHRLWLLSNDLGVDELVSFTDNAVQPHDAPALRVGPSTLPALRPARGTLADLAPAPEGTPPATRLRELLAGRGPEAGLHTIALNAAAAAVIGGVRPDWPTALADALDALADGAALGLVERLTAPRAGAAAGAVGHG